MGNCFVVVNQFLICASRSRINRKILLLCMTISCIGVSTISRRWTSMGQHGQLSLWVW